MFNWGYYQQKPIYKTILENEYLYLETINLGASLLVFKEKKSGIDIVLGGEDLTGFLAFSPYYLGASVGRCANRIANGQFCLNDKIYQLDKNNGFHSLHGGLDGFSFKSFIVKEESKTKVIYQYFSPNNESGYPGNLKTTITYYLEDKTLYWLVEGESDEDTLFNITNHSYFNLSGCKENILNHELFLPSTMMGLVNKDGLALEEVSDIKNSIFDFQKKKKVAKALLSEDKNIKLANGLDHPYIYQGKGLRAILENENLKLTVNSDYPSMHVYSGNYLPGNIKGKKGYKYKKNDGICFECQYYPNAINYSNHLKPLLYKNQKQQHFISYCLERKTYDN